MKILAFETSCDDTSIAIFDNEIMLWMDTKSQIKIHNETWGVVPEIAAREHANAIFEVLENVLVKCNTKIDEIDYIAVTTNPGLQPSLLTGITVANSIANVKNIPIFPINHIESHVFANFLERKEEEIKYPLVCLTVSGGHNDVFFMKDMWSFDKIWTSGDDAGWEAFDKVAKMLWLGYPGGPIISQLSKEYEEKWWISKELFPRVFLKKKEFDFSFSGLKSCVKREIDKRWELSREDILEICFEFELSVIEVLAYKLVNAAKEKWCKTVMLAWGVSANDRLKEVLRSMCIIENIEFIFPKKKVYSMDNAWMVGINAYYKLKYNKADLTDNLSI